MTTPGQASRPGDPGRVQLSVSSFDDLMATAAHLIRQTGHHGFEVSFVVLGDDGQPLPDQPKNTPHDATVQWTAKCDKTIKLAKHRPRTVTAEGVYVAKPGTNHRVALSRAMVKLLEALGFNLVVVDLAADAPAPDRP